MAERVGPIRPGEVNRQKLKQFPDAVFESFNELIVENDSNGTSVVDQHEVVKRMVSRGLDPDLIYKRGWLDIEGVYRKAG